MASLFEEMGGTYTLGAAGMQYPNLKLWGKKDPDLASTVERAILTSGRHKKA